MGKKNLRLAHQAKIELNKKKMDSIRGGVVTPSISDLCYACGIGSIVSREMAVDMFVEAVCDPIWC